MVDNKVLTPHGKAFLIAALDPMHDNQIQDLAGWPDLSDQASVVRCIKRQYTLSKPATVTGNWTCSINSNPILTPLTVNPVQHTNNVLHTADLTKEYKLGAVSIWRADAAVNDFSIGGGQIASLPAADKLSIDLPSEIGSGDGRLVGMGIEVVNTTAQIYKQGTVHVYRSPQLESTYETYSFQQNQVIGAVTVPTPYPMTIRQLQAWPNNESSATVLAGTLTWDAREGVYLVVPFMSTVNPVQPMEFVQPVLVDEFQRSDTVNLDSFSGMASTWPLSSAGINGIFYPAKWAPVHTAGCLFTGLSAETTLTITVNFYYEYFPNSGDLSLVTVAKPSASYDPVALQLYSEALASLPVGVRAKENGIGGWFADVVSRFGATVGTALAPIFGPASVGAGMAAQQIARSYMTSQSPKAPQLRTPAAAPARASKKPRVLAIMAPPPPMPKRDYGGKGAKLTKAQRRALVRAGVGVPKGM